MLVVDMAAARMGRVGPMVAVRRVRRLMVLVVGRTVVPTLALIRAGTPGGISSEAGRGETRQKVPALVSWQVLSGV